MYEHRTGRLPVLPCLLLALATTLLSSLARALPEDREQPIHITADKAIRDQLQRYEAAGYGRFPVCMAKTQYSFSTDPSRKGAPSHHVVPVREVRLSAGAGFIVVICGEIMTMPGLPRVPAAESIRLDADGNVVGLF